MGLVGVGSDNSRGTFDNVSVQVLPPQTRFENTDDFADGVADLFSEPSTGTWAIVSGRYNGTASGSAPATSMMALPVRAAGGSTVTAETIVRVVERRPRRHRLRLLQRRRLQVRRARSRRRARSSSGTGSRTSWVEDARFTTSLAAGVDYKLSLSLTGTAVTVTLNGAVLGSFSYYGAVPMAGSGRSAEPARRRSTTCTL